MLLSSVNVFSLMERPQAGGPERYYRPTYTSGWHDTNNRSGHNCLWKDNPVFLISVHIYFDIGSRSVKPSRMMEGHCLWRRASEKEREREGVCEWILRTVLDEQRHWQLLSLSICLSRPLFLSLFPSQSIITALFDSSSSPEGIFYEVQYTLSSRWID